MEAVNKNMVTEISISYRPSQLALFRPKITTGSEAYRQIVQGFDESTLALQEQFVVLYMNQASDVIGLYRASKGGITMTVVDIRLILSIALKVLATHMIVAHNHPSGNLKPSQADIELTAKLQQAGKFMDIKLVDHLIISFKGAYFSLADEGYL